MAGPATLGVVRPRPVDVAAWRTARDLADLGELTAEWLGGKLPYHPAYGGETPNEERTPLIPRLAGFNRAGYVTEDSQPGEPREDGWTQRACVFGYCNEAIAETL